MDKKNIAKINLIVALKLLKKRRGMKRRFQVHPINFYRIVESEFVLFYRILEFDDKFLSYMRMPKNLFLILLDLLKDRYIKILT